MQNEVLDRLAAEHIMGYGVYSASAIIPKGAPYPRLVEVAGGGYRFWTSVNSFTFWSPTTNEAHAALVREKMRAEGWKWDIEIGEDVYACCYRHEGTRNPYARGKEFASAIVRSALLAVEAITEEDLNA